MPSTKRSDRLFSNEYKIWLGRNPLTVWMKRRKVSQMEVAARMDVSTYAVYLWQHGTSVPNPDRFKLLANLTGIEDIVLQWANWKDAFSLTGND